MLAPLSAATLAAALAAPTAPPLPAADTVLIREWQVPWEQSRPRDPIVDGAGKVWFVGQRGNYLAMLDPASGEFRRHDLPERALPHNVVVGPDGDLWYAGNGDAHIGRMDPETGAEPNRFVGFDPASERFLPGAAVPSGGGTVRHMVFHAPTRAIWFGADTNTVGRAMVP